MAGTATPTVVQHRSRGVVRTSVALACTAGGVIDTTPVVTGYGRLVGVLYNGGLDASATITISDGRTGAALITYVTGVEGTPAAFRPTTVIVDNAGTAIVAAAAAPKVNRDIYVAGKVNVTVSAGGASETAILGLIVDESRVGDLANTV